MSTGVVLAIKHPGLWRRGGPVVRPPLYPFKLRIYRRSYSSGNCERRPMWNGGGDDFASACGRRHLGGLGTLTPTPLPLSGRGALICEATPPEGVIGHTDRICPKGYLLGLSHTRIKFRKVNVRSRRSARKRRPWRMSRGDNSERSEEAPPLMIAYAGQGRLDCEQGSRILVQCLIEAHDCSSEGCKVTGWNSLC